MFKSFCGLSLQAGPIVICSEYFELNISQREFYWTEYIIPNFRALNGLKNANWPKIGSGSSAVGEERVTSPKNVWVEGYKSTKEEPLSRKGTAILDRSAPPTNTGRIQIWSDPMYSVFLPNDRWTRKERVSSASHRSWPLGAFRARRLYSQATRFTDQSYSRIRQIKRTINIHS